MTTLETILPFMVTREDVARIMMRCFPPISVLKSLAQHQRLKFQCVVSYGTQIEEVVVCAEIPDPGLISNLEQRHAEILDMGKLQKRASR
jgi:hypothetical protein